MQKHSGSVISGFINQKNTVSPKKWTSQKELSQNKNL